MLIVGLVILLAAVVFGVAGVLENSGSEHTLGHDFYVLGISVTGSTGTLFLIGIVVGLVAALGLALLLASSRRASRRGSAARRELKQSRRETEAVSEERDALVKQRYTDRHPPPSAT